MTFFLLERGHVRYRLGWVVAPVRSIFVIGSCLALSVLQVELGLAEGGCNFFLETLAFDYTRDVASIAVEDGSSPCQAHRYHIFLSAARSPSIVESIRGFFEPASLDPVYDGARV